MPTVTEEEYVEFQHASYGSLILATPAVRCTNWGDLYGEPDKLGDDVRLLGQDGVSPQDRVNGPLRGFLTVWVFGTRDQDGLPKADPKVGVRENLDLVRQVVEVQTVQTLILHQRGGATPTADVQIVRGIIPMWETPTIVRTVLSFQLPNGALL